MSNNESTDKKGSATEPVGEVEKSVTLTAYLIDDYQSLDTRRDVADAFDPDHDYYQQSTYTDERRYLVIGEGDDAARVEIDTDTETKVLRQMVNNDIDGPVAVEVEHDEETSYDHTPGYKPPRIVRKAVLDELPSEFTVAGREVNNNEGFSSQSYDFTDSGDRVIFVRKDKLKKRRLLTHRSERDEKGKYDGDDTHWSLQLSVDLGPASEEVIDGLSEGFIGKLATALSRYDGIKTVRVSSCKVTRTGDCYDV